MLFAFDLDNTLVTRDHVLPAEIARSIAAARSHGHHVTVLTGRTADSASAHLRRLAVSDFYSVNHGALVIGRDGSVLRQATIKSSTVKSLIERYEAFPRLEYSCVVGNTIYVREPDDERWNWAHTSGQRIEHVAMFNGDPADKVVFHCPESGDRIRCEIAAGHPDLQLYHWDNHFLEVTGVGAHKGAALKLIAETLGVPRSDTVAFGDGINDVTMLEWAGHGVAVGPYAYPQVLDAADEHIASPEDLGVAAWLENNVLRI